MNEQKYFGAGWAAVAQAILFPAAIVTGIVQAAVGLKEFPHSISVFGISDILMVLFTGCAVYTMVMFRRMLNEIYNYKGLDTMITVSIWWAVIYYIGGLFTGGLAFWNGVDLGYLAVGTGLSIIMVMFIGVVDIIIAVRLFRLTERKNDMLLFFGVLTLIMGICEISVVFSFINLIIYPISAIILALLFFEVRRQAEFV